MSQVLNSIKSSHIELLFYRIYCILSQTLPTSSTQSPQQPLTNDPIIKSRCTVHYLDALTTVVHTRFPSENPFNVKLPNSCSRTGGHYYLRSLTIDAKNLQTSCHQKMAQSTRNVESSNMWWRPRPKQKLGDCSALSKKRYPCVSYSIN